MPIHVFVDETKSKGLLMAAARCPADDVAVNRKALRSLLLPGQERLHFNNENPTRRKKILDTIAGFRMLVDIYQADRATAANRSRCLQAIVRDNAEVAERLVIERDEPNVDSDGRALRAASSQFDCRNLRWDLLAPKADPLLWVPDGVAWAWMRGGDWRRRVAAYCEERAL
ncbi:hypothetical protein [Kribbella monticola]|uniref:hypothetical protein n=1 Tax=Kribbella monticola TaxID=2185285 RepID=UPI000DD4E748|nr:hypothetical protein [Kribbella monticola]